MNGWERYIKTVGILTVLLAALPLFFAVSAWVQVFTPGFGNIDSAQDWVRALSPIFYTLLLVAIGFAIFRRRSWAPVAWIIIVLLSLPASLIVAYGLFDGGPPYPYPNWLGLTFAAMPIILSLTAWVLLVFAYRHLGPGNNQPRPWRDLLLLVTVISLAGIAAVWLWLKDRNTIDLSPEIALYEHQTTVFFTEPYIFKATQTQTIEVTLVNASSSATFTANFPTGCQNMTATLLNAKNEAVGQASPVRSEDIVCTQALSTRTLAPQEKFSQVLELTIKEPEAGWHAIRVQFGDYINTAPVRLSGK
jgi:hypothetical protein